MAEGSENAMTLAEYREAYEQAKREKNPWVYPDICLNMVKHKARFLSNLEIKHLLNEAIRYFQTRVEMGDSAAAPLLEEARTVRARFR